MAQGYEPPTIVRLGSVHDLAQQTRNEVGTATDVFTQLTNGTAIRRPAQPALTETGPN